MGIDLPAWNLSDSSEFLRVISAAETGFRGLMKTRTLQCMLTKTNPFSLLGLLESKTKIKYSIRTVKILQVTLIK